MDHALAHMDADESCRRDFLDPFTVAAGYDNTVHDQVMMHHHYQHDPTAVNPSVLNDLGTIHDNTIRGHHDGHFMGNAPFSANVDTNIATASAIQSGYDVHANVSPENINHQHDVAQQTTVGADTSITFPDLDHATRAYVDQGTLPVEHAPTLSFMLHNDYLLHQWREECHSTQMAMGFTELVLHELQQQRQHGHDNNIAHDGDGVTEVLPASDTFHDVYEQRRVEYDQQQTMIHQYVQHARDRIHYIASLVSIAVDPAQYCAQHMIPVANTMRQLLTAFMDAMVLSGQSPSSDALQHDVIAALLAPTRAMSATTTASSSATYDGAMATAPTTTGVNGLLNDRLATENVAAGSRAGRRTHHKNQTAAHRNNGGHMNGKHESSGVVDHDDDAADNATAVTSAASVKEEEQEAENEPIVVPSLTIRKAAVLELNGQKMPRRKAAWEERRPMQKYRKVPHLAWGAPYNYIEFTATVDPRQARVVSLGGMSTASRVKLCGNVVVEHPDYLLVRLPPLLGADAEHSSTGAFPGMVDMFRFPRDRIYNVQWSVPLNRLTNVHTVPATPSSSYRLIPPDDVPEESILHVALLEREFLVPTRDNVQNDTIVRVTVKGFSSVQAYNEFVSDRECVHETVAAACLPLLDEATMGGSYAYVMDTANLRQQSAHVRAQMKRKRRVNDTTAAASGESRKRNNGKQQKRKALAASSSSSGLPPERSEINESESSSLWLDQSSQTGHGDDESWQAMLDILTSSSNMLLDDVLEQTSALDASQDVVVSDDMTTINTDDGKAQSLRLEETHSSGVEHDVATTPPPLSSSSSTAAPTTTTVSLTSKFYPDQQKVVMFLPGRWLIPIWHVFESHGYIVRQKAIARRKLAVKFYTTDELKKQAREYVDAHIVMNTLNNVMHTEHDNRAAAVEMTSSTPMHSDAHAPLGVANSGDALSQATSTVLPTAPPPLSSSASLLQPPTTSLTFAVGSGDGPSDNAHCYVQQQEPASQCHGSVGNGHVAGAVMAPALPLTQTANGVGMNTAKQHEQLVHPLSQPLRSYVIEELCKRGSPLYTDEWIRAHSSHMRTRGPSLTQEQHIQALDAYFWARMASPRLPEYDRYEQVLKFYQTFGLEVYLKKPYQRTGENRGRSSASGMLRTMRGVRAKIYSGASPHVVETDGGMQVAKAAHPRLSKSKYNPGMLQPAPATDVTAAGNASINLTYNFAFSVDDVCMDPADAQRVMMASGDAVTLSSTLGEAATLSVPSTPAPSAIGALSSSSVLLNASGHPHPLHQQQQPKPFSTQANVSLGEYDPNAPTSTLLPRQSTSTNGLPGKPKTRRRPRSSLSASTSIAVAASKSSQRASSFFSENGVVGHETAAATVTTTTTTATGIVSTPAPTAMSRSLELPTSVPLVSTASILSSSAISKVASPTRFNRQNDSPLQAHGQDNAPLTAQAHKVSASKMAVTTDMNSSISSSSSRAPKDTINMTRQEASAVSAPLATPTLFRTRSMWIMQRNTVRNPASSAIPAADQALTGPPVTKKTKHDEN